MYWKGSSTVTSDAVTDLAYQENKWESMYKGSQEELLKSLLNRDVFFDKFFMSNANKLKKGTSAVIVISCSGYTTLRETATNDWIN